MKKFMVLYLSKTSAEKQMNVSPEEMKKGMEPWLLWNKKNESAIVDLGTPLGNVWNMTKEGKEDGQTWIAGYSVIQAEDEKAVETILADHPHFMLPETSIQVLEMLPMPGI